MHGELAIDIRELRLNEGDLTIVSKDGEYLHICGNNNLLELIANAKISPITYYCDKIVEIRHSDYEFKRFGEGLGEYARATVHAVDNHGRFTLCTLHDGSEVKIHGSWLYDVRTNKKLDMSLGNFNIGVPF